MTQRLLTPILIITLAIAGLAQNPAQPQPQVATTLAFPLMNPPGSPPSLNLAISGVPGPSSSTKFYWLVSNFPIGNSSPSGPFQAFNVPATLSGANFMILNWPAVAGASTYDVLKTNTATPPTGACACAVVVGTAALTVNDQANATLAYTVNTFPVQSVTQQLDSEATGVAGLAHVMLRQGNVLVNDLSRMIQTRRVNYTFTAGDDAQGFAVVPVAWPVPFPDTNYTVVWGINDTDVVVDLNFFVGDIHALTGSGFNAIVRNFGPAGGGTGEAIIVHAFAIHD